MEKYMNRPMQIKHVYGEIISNKKIADDIFDMRIKEDHIAQTARPGQFVNVYIPRADLLLPRPVSVCETDVREGIFRIVYQAIGEGTAIISHLKPGDAMRMTGPAGNGFDLGYGEKPDAVKITIAGGGIGVPPLLFLARALAGSGAKINITTFLGFKTETRAILTDEFEKVGAARISTDDGSLGYKGFVPDHMRAAGAEADVIYACGPAPMLKNVAAYAAEKNVPCFVSMEERMACGLGACVGCAVKVKTGDGFTYKKACSDGPVFDAREVLDG